MFFLDEKTSPFAEYRVSLDFVASVWDVARGGGKMCICAEGSERWDKFSWLDYCWGAAGMPLTAPIKAGIRVIGGAELWTVKVILCYSSIQDIPAVNHIMQRESQPLAWRDDIGTAGNL